MGRQFGIDQEFLNHELYTAVVMNQPAKVTELIAQGADPNGTATIRQLMIHAAADHGFADVIDALVAGGADVNRRSPQQGFTAAYIATGQGRAKALARLIHHGAEIKKPVGTNAKSPPLDVAVLSGNAACVKLLLDHGADKDQLSENGSNYIHIAAILDKPEVIDVLAAYGVDINHRNEEGNTPAHYANEYKHPNALWMLKTLDADFTIKNNAGVTPEAGLKAQPWKEFVLDRVSEYNARQTKRRYVRNRTKPSGPK